MLLNRREGKKLQTRQIGKMASGIRDETLTVEVSLSRYEGFVETDVEQYRMLNPHNFVFCFIHEAERRFPPRSSGVVYWDKF